MMPYIPIVRDAIPHPSATAGSIHHAPGTFVMMIVFTKRAADRIVPMSEQMPSLCKDALCRASEYWNLIIAKVPKIKIELIETARRAFNSSGSSIPLRKSLLASAMITTPKIDKMKEMATDARFSRCFNLASMVESNWGA